MSMIYCNQFFSLEAGGEYALQYRIAGSETSIPISWPRFEINNKNVSAAPADFRLTDRRFLNDAIEELTFSGGFGDGLFLTMELRVCKNTPFIRFRYRLCAEGDARMTKKGGENLVYLSYPSARNAARTEVRFSEYDALAHTYCLRELPAFQHERELMGPILTEQRGDCCMLTAYEHGSMYPDLYVCFRQTGGDVAISAVKGNYWDGQPLREQPFEGVWLQLGAVKGVEQDLAEAYRTFQLFYCSLNRESRKPYIFYNTWAFQERNKFYNGQEYLSSMNEARIEQEIEIAHQMGVDVFVIDTGWYQKTGDWETNTERFPSGMKHIHDLLQARGMKLGLWFAPPAAAVTSESLRRYPRSVLQQGEEKAQPHPVWETEESYDMCLVSDFWEGFADRLIALAQSVGVRYFKWDAVGMFGCDDPGHLHGGAGTSQRDRAENYSFRLGLYLSKVADKLCAAVPDAIVDMDITEGGRYVGLGFLSSGKYFAMNNGPYYPNYDISVPKEQWINVFVNPGPARTWVCRKPLCYDKWIPSVLMMTHYLPDDPADSQIMNLASLVLGQNGIWGDLPEVSPEGVKRFGEVLAQYKKVRDDVTRAYPVVYGTPGDLFEVHEKIDPETGRGLISVFANAQGVYRYRIHAEAAGKPVIFGNALLYREQDGLWIELKTDRPTAAILFFPALYYDDKLYGQSEQYTAIRGKSL